MLRAVWFYVGVVLHQLCIWPRLLRAEYLQRTGRKDRALAMAQATGVEWCRLLLWLAGCRVKIHGQPATTATDRPAALVVSNHQGLFDIPLIGATLGRPFAFVAKVELSRIPLVSRWMKLMGCVFITREDRRQALEVVKQTQARLQEGIHMVIFPEGTRSYATEPRPFRRGSVGIALKAGVPVLPVTVNGTWKLLNPRQRGIRSGEVDIHFHAPVPTAGLQGEEAAGLSERIQAIICGPLGVPPPPPGAEPFKPG